MTPPPPTDTGTEPLATVAGLTIVDDRGNSIVDDVSFQIGTESAHALVGASGSGKTTAALSLIGWLSPGLRHRAGTVTVAGTHPFTDTPRAIRSLRREIAYVGQDPAAALTPTMTVGALLDELRGPDAELDEILNSVELPTTASFRSRYPHQLSGGQRRRVALARAIVSGPRMLIVDEPTAGLDPVALDLTLTLIARLRAEFATALLVITHDLDAARTLASTVSVFDGGRIVEAGPTTDLFTAPASAPLRRLVDAKRSVAETTPTTPDPADPILTLTGVTVAHGRGEPLFAPVDLTLRPGEAVGLVGPSGVGKSTLARAIAGVHPVRSGTIVTATSGPDTADSASGRAPSAHATPISIVPQDPATSLNPALRIRTSIGRSLPRGSDRSRRISELLAAVDIEPELADRRPGTLSGGQRQRAALARSLAARPQVLLCDEVTSALDTATEAQVLDVLDDIRERERVALVVITHSAQVARRLCHRIIELHPIDESDPQHIQSQAAASELTEQ